MKTKNKIELRPYQKEAVDKIIWSKNANLEGNDIVVLPTAAGKSIIISNVVHQLNEPTLIIQPSKEILEQNYNKLLNYVNENEMGIYSASMNEKNINFFTFATIGSIYKKPEFFVHFGLVIIDESHLLGKSSNTMFMKFLNKVNEIRKSLGKPPLKIIGLTATPFRQDILYKYEDGGLYSYTTTKLINRMKGNFWTRLLYNVSVKELIDQKYLCPLEYIDKTLIEQKDLKLNKSMSDFDLEDYEKRITDKEGEILNIIRYAESVSKSVLVFCSSVKQSERLSSLIKGSKSVSAKTEEGERNEIINGFKDGKYKTVLNVNVLSIGFDHPALDCIVLLRPTRSICRYVQLLGRGVRIAPGKTSCKVIDLTSTVKNLGRFETIKVEKINGKWELTSEMGSWHNKILYKYEIKTKDKRKDISFFVNRNRRK